MPIPWNEDPPGSDALIVANLTTIAGRILADTASRHPPTVSMAQEWHREVYRGVPLPVPYYAGEIRNSDPAYPELIGYEVSVGTARGMSSANVPAALVSFEAGLRAVTERMDGVLAVGGRPTNPADLYAVLEVAGLAHGGWVRIHPLANGNGRIARLWVNWIAVRYGLPFFLALRPRPASLVYAAAAAASMRGDDRSMVVALLTLLNQHI